MVLFSSAFNSAMGKSGKRGGGEREEDSCKNDHFVSLFWCTWGQWGGQKELQGDKGEFPWRSAVDMHIHVQSTGGGVQSALLHFTNV
jgi:hypothetical protein